jgi:glyceraldehyde 3-phosphate dehydrogenase
MRVGVNGFGRIGRAVTKIIAEAPDFEVVAINDPNTADNLAYLYNYDSTYGRARPRAVIDDQGRITIGDNEPRFTNETDITEVAWEDSGVDVLIDASGIHQNVIGANELVAAGRTTKAIITHSPPSDVDKWIIMGVNDESLDIERDHVVSTTICDANAIAHPLMALDAQFGVVAGSITTLHPWLSYQNLVDGPVGFQRFPGAYWDDYALGRASGTSLIAKETTAVTALRPVLPGIEERLTSMSFRTPTSIVSVADLSIQVEKSTSEAEVLAFFTDQFAGSSYVALNSDPLVGVDFIGEEFSAVLDLRWNKVSNGTIVKVVLWYDNEWGYSCRVRDLARALTTA